DELSSVLGVLLAQGIEEPWFGWLRGIQNDLFDVGADLCIPSADPKALRVTPAYTAAIEAQIDEVNESLQPLKSFVLPGGTPAAAWLHMARTVCRRAERLVSELNSMSLEDAAGPVNPEVLVYLNRLSDLLFVLARAVNSNGEADVEWEPGARQG
ncbi:MAG: cob(I)yrinic acid a,c-diamide adenosyltransferase, partial [Planctomycetes bacterium]|nr:cob(I)yrinic acid a,c-diamide adenosyltransferase [Planctomycetota bacterium]